MLSLALRAVTNAGQDKFEFSSGNIAEGTLFFILLIKSILFFSIKKLELYLFTNFISK